MNEFTQFIEKDRIINDELVVPAYRAFCKKYNLNLHFWDELPIDKVDLKIEQEEILLHKEAMDLFNKMKPEFEFWKGKIIKYHFITWDGEFDYKTWEIKDFIKESHDEIAKLKILDKRFGILLILFVLLLFVFIQVILLFILKIDTSSWLICLDYLVSITICSLICWAFAKDPTNTIKNNNYKLSISYLNRLEELKDKLTKLD